MNTWKVNVLGLTCLLHISPGHRFVQAHDDDNFWKKIPNFYVGGPTTNNQMLENKHIPAYPPSNPSPQFF